MIWVLGRAGHQFGPCRLDCLDLLQQEFEPIQRSYYLSPKVRLQRSAIARSKPFKPFAAISVHRRKARHALRKQQTLNPVYQLHPLRDKCDALSAVAPAIFLRGGGWPHHCAYPRFAALVGQQATQQCLAI